MMQKYGFSIIHPNILLVFLSVHKGQKEQLHDKRQKEGVPGIDTPPKEIKGINNQMTSSDAEIRHQSSISFPFVLASSIHLGTTSLRNLCFLSFSFGISRPIAA